jgi:hyperosmotically inducible protein
MNARRWFTGCVLLVAIGSLLACATTDAGITTKVKAKLAADETVSAAQIEVDTADGVVTLTGNVDSEAAKSRALELTRDTDGVVNVVDRISARTASGRGDAPATGRTLGERVDDAEITMSVKSRLLDDPLVKGLKIDVDTREGVVYLTGSVNTADERERAIQLARDTRGVLDVQANLTVP